MYIPERADIVWLNFSPQLGCEQGNRRPALVLSWSEYNRLGLCWVVPITSKNKGLYFEMPLPKELQKVKGVVLCDQFRCTDWQKRDIDFIEKTTPLLVDEVISKAKIIYME